MRLFTGIALAPHVRDNLARVLQELRPLAALNWAPVENLHITSKFIGEWPEERLAELERTLENLSPPGGFEVTIARFGYFPNPHNPRTLFAGIQAEAPGPVAQRHAHLIQDKSTSAAIDRVKGAGQAGSALAELADRIDEALRPLGVAHENRPYSPHLTLARIKHGNIRELREHIAHMTNFDFGTFQVSEFHLYLSKPGPKGSVYTSLATYSLTAAASIQA